MHLFLLVFFGFAVGAGFAVVLCAAAVYLPTALSERRLAQRLEDVSAPVIDLEHGEGESLVMRPMDGPLPSVDRLVAKTIAGSKL
ncbi:MAG TPA: hypothetical protein VHZ73_10860, partial [Vicinamibacterales bacterium]|nr:hypothetical protein [Vicinamibacterales bacterium]